jgi:hypothetical protein
VTFNTVALLGWEVNLTVLGIVQGEQITVAADLT